MRKQGRSLEHLFGLERILPKRALLGETGTFSLDLEIQTSRNSWSFSALTLYWTQTPANYRKRLEQETPANCRKTPAKMGQTPAKKRNKKKKQNA